ncbi:Symplekin tight junction protein C terminal-domain-containing protein [Phakopsora pachyrhizi]|uniref:Symplekin tight junction protein C terminal-domain-containing protein n=1 Tax=Phakopsora pachyrhizi TaxID=170000 RepID=A0AAV0BQ84_PHAPC|nr:Symplekin tight junction protein C terminal-domain-containing protein [Phakopsora pachyrhizi]
MVIRAVTVPITNGYPRSRDPVEWHLWHQGTLLKFSPLPLAGFWLQKTPKVWKSTFCCISAIFPHSHPYHDLDMTLYYLHGFSSLSPSASDLEFCRLRLKPSLVVCVLEDKIHGKSLVLKVTGQEMIGSLNSEDHQSNILSPPRMLFQDPKKLAIGFITLRDLTIQLLQELEKPEEEEPETIKAKPELAPKIEDVEMEDGETTELEADKSSSDTRITFAKVENGTIVSGLSRIKTKDEFVLNLPKHATTCTRICEQANHAIDKNFGRETWQNNFTDSKLSIWIRSIDSQSVVDPGREREATSINCRANTPRVKHSELLTPVELLVLLHRTEEGGYSIKQAIEAIGICFLMTEIFKPVILAAFMQQVVDKLTLPVLFLRTAIQAVQTYKSLQAFVSTTLLSRLILKKIWVQPQLWEGFMRCAKIIAPHSFGALLPPGLFDKIP